MSLRFTNYEHKLFKHLDRLAALTEGDLAPPVNVEIDLSNRCSLGCQSCHFAHTHSRGPLAEQRQVEVGDLMETGLAQRIVQELASYGVRSITWTGGGEPTLHSEYLKVLAVSCERGIQQGLYTNGCHIGQYSAGKLAEYCEWIYVSLDAVDGRTYLAEKKVPRFDDACKGIRRLAQAGACVGVGFLLHSENWRQAEEMVHLAQNLGATYCQLRPTIEFDLACPGKPTGDRNYCHAALDKSFYWPEFPVELDIKRFEEYGSWENHGYDVCWWSGLQTVITPNGAVWTCCNKRGEDGHNLGNLHEESFEEIWARRKIAAVDDRCRVMCRGHMPNKILHGILSEYPHSMFI
jgi:MoaA/NifB/PqqE/SkfB family radical SAM enzyme